MTDIKNIIENAWDNVSSLTSENKDIAEAVREVIGNLIMVSTELLKKW